MIRSLVTSSIENEYEMCVQMLKTKDGVKIMTVLPQKWQREIKVNNINFDKCHATKKVYCRCCHVCF